MIQVDISNIWNTLSLRDLLGLERQVFQAHLNLSEACVPGRMMPPGELDRVLAAGSRIREESEVLLVIGGCAGTRGMIELLQGSHRNLGRGRGDPQIFFTGEDLSTRVWNELLRLIEGKHFSLCVIGGGSPESAIAFRNLKWRLERRYGTDEARQRIWAVTTESAPLYRIAREAGWETFVMPENMAEDFAILSPAGLLPLAAAGIDIGALLRGAEEAAEAFDLRSYENPVWLYAAARSLLAGAGRSIELLSTPEPDFSGLGRWWQQLFTGVGSSFPVCNGLCTDQFAERLAETVIRFDPPELRAAISTDVKDLGGLNRLSGSTLDQVEEAALRSLVEAHTDMGIPVITIDCGALDAEALGQLLWFFLLSRSLCLGLSGC